MNTLAPQDREKLAKILGMLGSDHDGERAAAGAMASRFIKSRGLTWWHILQDDNAFDYSKHSKQKEYTAGRPSGWSSRATKIRQRYFERLSDWEKEFIESIISKKHEWPNLTEKQESVFRRIVDKILGGWGD